ncbi:hypothetical protein BH23BAC4_BH23BAC4_17060 [soil metagenome]
MRFLPLVLLLLSACRFGTDEPAQIEQPADTSSQTVPITFEGRGEAALVVPVFINGEGPFDFVLDTGATMTCVSEPLAEALELPPQRGAVGMGAGIGGSGQVALVRLDSVRVGETLATDLGGCVLDLAHMGAVGLAVDGLLGLNFLRAFRVTLDFELDTVRFEAIN